MAIPSEGPREKPQRLIADLILRSQRLQHWIAEERLDWFTCDIQPDGAQICAIRPAGRPQAGIVLDRRASQLL
jgi:hypothetical protein